MIGEPPSASRRAALWAAAGLVVVAGAGVAGWESGRAPAAAATAPPPSAWALPELRHADIEADAAILRARRPWGGSVAPSQNQGSTPASATAVPWRLVGTIVRSDGRFALIRVGPQPGARIEYFGVGDRLPDGGIVLQIAPDSIMTQGGAGLAAGPIVYRLFDKKS